MKLTVLDSYAQTKAILEAAPDQRQELLQELRATVDGMYPWLPDGPDHLAVHRGTFGFPLTGVDGELREALETFQAADAWDRIAVGVERAEQALLAARPDVVLPDELRVLLTLGDPTDDYYMRTVEGLAAFGGIPGFIELTLWPTATVLSRLEAIIAHELHHNVRYAPGGVVWNPVEVQLGEQVIAEGLADVFAEELYPGRGYTHFAAAAADQRPVIDRVIGGLATSGMWNFVATWIFGDGAAARFGAKPLGLPTGAGYAVGEAIVEAYLGATGTTAAAAVQTDWHEIAEIGIAAL